MISLTDFTSHLPWNFRLWIVMMDFMPQKKGSPLKRSFKYTGMSPVCQSWQCTTSGWKSMSGSADSTAFEK